MNLLLIVVCALGSYYLIEKPSIGLRQAFRARRRTGQAAAQT